MAGFYEMTIGQQMEFQRVMASAGFKNSDIVRIIKEPKLAVEMYAAIQSQSAVSVPAWNPPSWWRTYDQQIARTHQKFGDIWLPDPPVNFRPRLGTKEVPLIHVPIPGSTEAEFNSLWDKADAPTGSVKYRSDEVKANRRNLRLSPNKREYTEPVWLAIDLEHGRNERPDSFWGRADIAASEVFSALIQFPEWPLTWINGDSAPNLSGYQLEYDGLWSLVPYLGRWVYDDQLILHIRWADDRLNGCTSPTVRVLYV